MKRVYFEPDVEGFLGAYWPCRKESDCCIIAQFGDDIDDTLAKCGVKYFHDFGLNVMSMAPGKGDYSHHNYPVESYGRAIEMLRSKGNRKFAICGGSTQGMDALVAASYYPEITLTIAFTPSDWIMEGFYMDGLDDCGERPGNGYESSLSWKGEPLPFLPFPYRHPEHWTRMKEACRKNRDRSRSIEIFDKAEERTQLTEEMMIKVENIRGHIVFFGSEDDVMWNTVKYIKRMDERLRTHGHDSTYEMHLYEHCTHFVFPEGLWRKAFVGAGTLMTALMFREGRKHMRECRKSRKDIDRCCASVIRKWMDR